MYIHYVMIQHLGCTVYIFITYVRIFYCFNQCQIDIILLSIKWYVLYVCWKSAIAALVWSERRSHSAL